MAFGWLQIMPEVFYDMDLDDFFLMQKGFFNKRKDDHLQIAKAAFYPYAIGRNIAGENANMLTFVNQWFGEKPKPIDKEARKTRSQEMMKRVKYTTQLIEEKEKVKKQMKNN